MVNQRPKGAKAVHTFGSRVTYLFIDFSERICTLASQEGNKAVTNNWC